MQPTNPHPTDEQLFDYMGGTLPRAQAVEVAGHVATCQACAGAVRDAQASLPWARGAATAMPPAAAARMHERLAEDFALRAPGRIAAASGAGSSRAAVPGASGWRRWVVPALAFGMLATLAGVSVLGLGDEGTGSGGVPAVQSTGGDAKGGAARERLEGDTAKPMPDETSAEALSQPGTATPEGLQGEVPAVAEEQLSTKDAATTAEDFALPGAAQPAVGAIDADAGGAIVAPGSTGELCAVSFGGTTPVLPDGRVPVRVTQGPFGIVVACG